MARLLIGLTTDDEDGAPRLTVLTRVFCCERAPDGGICSLGYRHRGDHEVNVDGRVVGRWAGE